MEKPGCTTYGQIAPCGKLSGLQQRFCKTGVRDYAGLLPVSEEGRREARSPEHIGMRLRPLILIPIALRLPFSSYSHAGSVYISRWQQGTVRGAPWNSRLSSVWSRYVAMVHPARRSAYSSPTAKGFPRAEDMSTSVAGKGAMSIEWSILGQQGFDRAVEALVLRRLGEGVRAVNGRGGDNGIDIELVQSGKHRIFQLKYFPEGFSGGFKAVRRKQIKNSFDSAIKHKPTEWTLIVPGVCTNEEVKFVKALKGKRRIKVSIVDRDELDSWLTDDPNLDSYFQRNPIEVLMHYAKVFNQEAAAFLGGYDDIRNRISALATVIDTVDPHWQYGFANDGVTTSITARALPMSSPASAGFQVALRTELNDAQNAILATLQENIGYATSDSIRIPSEMVEWVRIEGPALLEGQHPPGDVEIRLGANLPRIGQIIELRTFGYDAADKPHYYEGEVTHINEGPLGHSLDILFCEGQLELRFKFPHTEEAQSTSVASAKLRYTIPNARPSVVADLLTTARNVRAASLLELYVGDQRLTKMGGIEPISADQYDEDKLIIEQFAYDLDIVQRHCNRYFNLPKSISPRDRIDIRVARILLEGGIVASPKARTFTAIMTGEDSARLRQSLTKPWMMQQTADQPYAVEIAGRVLTIGDVYVVHPEATAINGEEAIAALDAREAANFPVKLRPGNGHYFYLALADRPIEDHYNKPVSLWSLVGIEQPDTAAMLEGTD